MLEQAFKEIADYLRCAKYGNIDDLTTFINSSGDSVKDIDIICQDIIIKHIKLSAINIV